MTNAANACKTRWNAANYVQIKVSVDPEIAAGFKAACEASGVSMASILSVYMAKYGAVPIKSNPSCDAFATRRKRRSVVKSIIQQMGQVRDAEERYKDGIPENLQRSSVYEAAEQSVSLMEEAIQLLESTY